MSTSTTILVTGAEGFAGRRLITALADARPAARIVGTTRGGEAVAGCHTTLTLDLTCGDIAAVLKALKPTLVFHLAARSSVAQSFGESHLTFADNVTACLRLAAALRSERPGTPLVFASSGEVYGAAFRREAPIRETTPPEPQNAYARSKLAGEFAFADILAPVSPVIALRLFNHFGPGQDERFVIPSFAAQLRAIASGRQKPVIKVGNLDAVRDFLPLSDVLGAYLAAAGLAEQSGPGWRTYNVGSGKGRSIRSILDDLVRLSRLEVVIEVDPERLRPSDIPQAIADTAVFRSATGWQPVADWDAALAALVVHP